MASSEFSLRLQYGIVGGYIPAQPKAIHTMTLAKDAPQTLAINSAYRPQPGQVNISAVGGLLDAPAKTLAVKNQGVQALLDELHGILKDIPMESPPGSEDIYGMDTSIAWGSEDLQWCNSAPGGCIHLTSETQPTEEDKAKFRRAVEIVNILVNKANNG